MVHEEHDITQEAQHKKQTQWSKQTISNYMERAHVLPMFKLFISL